MNVGQSCNNIIGTFRSHDKADYEYSVCVFRFECAHFEKCQPANLMCMLSIENAYSSLSFDLKVPDNVNIPVSSLSHLLHSFAINFFFRLV